MTVAEKEIYFSEIFPFWDKLISKEKNLIINNSQLLKYKKGDTIHDSSECTGVLLIKEGQLRVYIVSAEGREVTLYRLNKGDICVLTASCILKNINFNIYVDAAADSEILCIAPFAFKELKAGNIIVENFINEIINESFSDTMWTMEQILFMSFDKRLAIYLLDQPDNELYITHEDIARDVGSAREVVSRMLKYFQNEGMVSLSRGTITIKDRNKLKKLLA